MRTGLKLATAATLLAAFVSGAIAETSSAHTRTYSTVVRWVPVAGPDAAGEYELRISSRVPNCYRRVHVQVIQNNRIVYAARTTATGVAPDLNRGGARRFGSQFAGSSAVVRTRTFRRGGGHVHRCGGKRTPFPTPRG